MALRTDLVDGTVMATTHKDQHNEANQAIFDLVAGVADLQNQIDSIPGAGATGYDGFPATSGTITLNMANRPYCKFSGQLSGNATFAFTGFNAAGQEWIIRVQQPNASVATITWPATVKWPNGIAPPPSTGAGRIDKYLFEFVGINYIEAALIGNNVS